MDFVLRQVHAECQAAGITGVTLALAGSRSLTPPTRLPAPLTLLSTLTISYADDQAVVEHSLQAIHQVLLIAERIFGEWGLRLNFGPGKTEVVALVPPPAAAGALPGSLQLARGQVLIVQKYKYLGSFVSAGGGQAAEFSRRLGMAAAAFRQLSGRWLCNRAAPLKARIDVYKATVIPVLIYGAAESWAPTRRQMAALDAFNTACLRRMMRLTLLDRVPNEELFKATKMPAVSDLIQMHRLRLVGHMARHPAVPAHQLLHAHGLPDQAVVKRGTRVTWQVLAAQDVAAALEGLGVRAPHPEAWAQLARDRAVWGKLTRAHLTYFQ